MIPGSWSHKNILSFGKTVCVTRIVEFVGRGGGGGGGMLTLNQESSTTHCVEYRKNFLLGVV